MDTLRKSETLEYIDQPLFWLFRHHAALPEVIRVEKLLSLLVAAESHRRLSVSRETPTSALESESHVRLLREARTSYEVALEQIRQALKRYRWSSRVEGYEDGFREILEGDETDPEYSRWEHTVVRVLLDQISNPGELSRFRRCSDCENWFYANTSHQRFCSLICRRHFTAKSGEFKAKRRNYMRNVYRPQQRQQEERGKALATEVIRNKKKGAK